MGMGYCVKIIVYVLKDDRYEFVCSIEFVVNE